MAADKKVKLNVWEKLNIVENITEFVLKIIGVFAIIKYLIGG